MADYVIEDLTGIKPLLLMEEMRDLGEGITGCSHRGDVFIVHVPDGGASDAEIEAIIAAHDDTGLTPQEQKTAQLQALRDANKTPLAKAGATVAKLVDRIQWLEEEIRQLKGL